MDNKLLSLVVILGVILVSMVLHELAHGLVAYWLGDNTAKDDGRLTLNPLKHLDPVMSILIPVVMFLSGGPIFGGAKPVPVDTKNLKHGAWGMALVAAAGPLTNFLLAFISFIVLKLGFMRYAGGIEFIEGIGGYIALEMVMVNLGFGIFNLLPIPPLDGSRILYAIAPDPVRNVMEGMEHYGLFIVMALVVLLPGVLSSLLGGAVNGILEGFDWLTGWISH